MIALLELLGQGVMAIGAMAMAGAVVWITLDIITQGRWRR